MILRVENLTRRFGSYTAVDDLSLTVPEHTLFGLLGPNGAGKTTLLRMVMGLLAPSEGRLRLFDDLRAGTARAQRQIGYMPQQLALYGGLTVAENVRFFGRLYGVSEGELAQRVPAVLERVALHDVADRRCDTLSGGMQRRAMLASALVHRPRLLILDEPTAGVDPVLRLAFWRWFRELASEGASVIVTTHHIAEAARCDTVAFLRTGRVLTSGAPDELMAQYGASDLEAAFVSATGDGLGNDGSPA